MGFHERLAEWSAAGWPLIANHLWQATILFLMASGAARLLERASARARYMVWLIAALKFAVPSALIVLLASQVGIKLPSLLDCESAVLPGVTIIYQVAEPVAQYSEPSNLPAAHNEIYCALTAIWIAVATALVALWGRRRMRFSTAIRAGHEMSSGREIEALIRVRAWLRVKRPIKLVITPGLVEPGVWRIWRPVIVMPDKMSEELTTAELEAVMMHEAIHVIRWDNLVNCFQLFFCCLFWFHPVVWLIDRKLLAEREQACDEQVIEFGGAAKVYASSLLKVFRFCLGCRLAGVSYATGSNLRRRIEQIMTENTDKRFALSHRILVAAIAAAVIGFSLAAGLFGYAGASAQSKSGASGGIAGGIPGGVSGGVPGGVTGGIEGGVPGGAEGGIISEVDSNSEFQLSEPPPPTPQDSKRIIEQVEQAPELTAQFINRNDAPIAITDVKVKTVLVTPMLENSSDDSARLNYHAVKTMVSMVNNTDLRIKGIKVQFTNKETKYILITDRMGLRIEPRATYSFGKSSREFMFYTNRLGNPETLTAEIIGVLFENGTVWGQTPRSPRTPPPPPPPSSDVPAPVPPVTASGEAKPTAPAPSSDDRPPDGTKIIRKSGGVLQTSAIKRVQPDYPPLAMTAQVSGAVQVEIVVNEEGTVTSARAVDGHPLLRSAAVEAARQWQFNPTLLEGVPVRVLATLTFNFSL